MVVIGVLNSYNLCVGDRKPHDMYEHLLSLDLPTLLYNGGGLLSKLRDLVEECAHNQYVQTTYNRKLVVPSE